MATYTEVRSATDVSNLPLRRYGDQGLTALRRVSWSALWAGNAVTWATLILLSMLGIGFATGTAWGTACWFFFSVIASFYAGGRVSARLAGIPRTEEASMHGMVTWAITAVEAFIFAGGLVQSVASGISRAPTVTAGGVGGASVGTEIFNALVAAGQNGQAAAAVTISAWIIFGLLIVGFFAAWAGGFTAYPTNRSKMAA